MTGRWATPTSAAIPSPPAPPTTPTPAAPAAATARARCTPTPTATACVAPARYVDNDADDEPECATNDTDDCGVCGGPGRQTWYLDADGDGLGDDLISLEACDGPVGYADVGGDPEPACATNDTDDCGVCAGGNASMDCGGLCNGEASLDGCGICSGGGTGIEPAVADEDGDGIPDACDDCPIALQSMLIVQWQAVPHYDRASNGPYTFQAILYQNGDFRFQYREMEPFNASATVGYQLDADTANLIARDNDFVLDHPVVHVHPRDDGRYEADYAQPLEWFDIQDVGQRLDLGDDAAQAIQLGFPFPFNGANYNQVTVSSNGMIVIDGNVPDFRNGALPTGGTRGMLAPFWDDLNPAAGGEILWYVATPACEEDCNGILGGFAFQDACGLCVGGDTGRAPSQNVDCNGDCDGEAFIDDCGQCVGGNTGHQPAAAGDCRPDLIVDQAYLASTAIIDYLDVDDQCLIEERCVHGLGRRKLLRFGTRIANIGPADLQLGRPQEGVDHWIWSQCHNHFHYEAYASYDLANIDTGEVLPIGAKSGFSVIDIGVWDPQLAPNGCRGYNGNNQGITSGCQDTYSRNLQCQWIDITDVADGTYDMIVTTNPEQQIPEVSYENNSATVRVRINGDQLQVVQP
ncbi:MAG: lysyl oxidase family protein [bacterium]